MTGNIMKTVSSIGLLIMLYLFLSHSSQTAKILDSIGYNSVQAIATLQGKAVGVSK